MWHGACPQAQEHRVPYTGTVPQSSSLGFSHQLNISFFEEQLFLKEKRNSLTYKRPLVTLKVGLAEEQWSQTYPRSLGAQGEEATLFSQQRFQGCSCLGP